MTRVAVVTGGSTGIGFAVCHALVKRGVFVVLTSRNICNGEAAVERIRADAPNIEHYPLDVTSVEQTSALRTYLEAQFGRLDILINNAGVHHDRGASIAESSVAKFRLTLETNLVGPFILTKLLLPLMRPHEYGRIVNISSGMGRLSAMAGGSAGYRISKAGMNALTLITAVETAGENIKVNSIRPGRVWTRMGSKNSTVSPEEAAVNIVTLAMLPDSGPTGKFFSGTDLIDW